MNSDNILVLDVETTTHNKGHPFDPRNFLVSYASLAGESDLNFTHYLDPDFISRLNSYLDSVPALVGFNIKFDIHWMRNITGRRNFGRIKVWDCQLAEFVYSGQEGYYASLNEVCEKYGLPTKIDLVAQYWDQGISTEDIPVPILREYNEWDVQLTKMLFDVQQRLLSEKQKKLVWLLGEDLKAIQSAEFNGIKFDFDRARQKVSEYNDALLRIERELAGYLPAGIPDGCWNWDSGDHVSALLYGGEILFDWATEKPAIYKSGAKKGESYIKRSWHETKVSFPQRFKPLEGSEVKKTKDDPTAVTRFYQVDQPTLSQLKTKNPKDRELLSLLRSRSDKIKVVEMIQSIINKSEQMNWQDGMIHGQFNQNVVVTGRLSSSGPNLQNTPVEVDELFVSRYEH